MKIQKSINEMNDRELRRCRRVLRLRRERRCRVMLFSLAMLVTVGMVLVFTLSYQTIRISANSGFKYYTSVTVEAGENLWDLADAYMDYDYYKNKNSYIAEVQHINHLDESCSIVAGQVLILPYYSNEYVR